MKTRFSQYSGTSVILAGKRGSRRHLLGVLARMSNVRSFIILRKGEGLTSCQKKFRAYVSC